MHIPLGSTGIESEGRSEVDTGLLAYSGLSGPSVPVSEWPDDSYSNILPYESIEYGNQHHNQILHITLY